MWVLVAPILTKDNADEYKQFIDLVVKSLVPDINENPELFKAMTYMCAYFFRAEDETSEAMKQAAREALAGNKSDYGKIKAMARAYATKRECSVQEGVYLVMPELWLRKIFPVVIFLNSNIPEKRYKIFKKKDEADELPDDSNDIFQRNTLDRYIDRPNEHF